MLAVFILHMRFVPPRSIVLFFNKMILAPKLVTAQTHERCVTQKTPKTCLHLIDTSSIRTTVTFLLVCVCPGHQAPRWNTESFFPPLPPVTSLVIPSPIMIMKVPVVR